MSDQMQMGDHTITTPDGVEVIMKDTEWGAYAEPVKYRGLEAIYADYFEGPYQWYVTGDFRTVETQWEITNHEIGDQIVKQVDADVYNDSESSQAFLNTRTLEDAKKVIDVIVDGGFLEN